MSSLAATINAAVRRLDTMFPGFFSEAKHNHYKDFGYPEVLTFSLVYDMYRRNGIAHSAVAKTVMKTWQDNPFLLDHQRDGSGGKDKGETTVERDIRTRFDDLRVWQQIAEADRRSMVGAYAGLILRVADSKQFREPVDTVGGGLDGLVEVIPAWEGQLQVAEWDGDETSETYGWPKMYQFNEASVPSAIPGKAANRQFNIHPDRVVILSRDGSVNGRSALEPGYNDLMTMEKVSGAGGEGFWKNAKSAPVLQVDKDARLDAMAAMMGVPVTDLADKMNDQVEDWQKGFDRLLMIQGMEAKTLGITLPSPEHFFAIALECFAASISMPKKILVGSQSGERASTEDATEWAKTIMSRRTNYIVPCLMDFVRRLERFKILPEADWHIDWTDLTESSMSEKIDRAVSMSTVNMNMAAGGEIVFTPEEIRQTVDLEPLSEADKFRDDTGADDQTAALTPPVTKKAQK